MPPVAPPAEVWGFYLPRGSWAAEDEAWLAGGLEI